MQWEGHTHQYHNTTHIWGGGYDLSTKFWARGHIVKTAQLQHEDRAKSVATCRADHIPKYCWHLLSSIYFSSGADSCELEYLQDDEDSYSREWTVWLQNLHIIMQNKRWCTSKQWSSLRAWGSVSCHVNLWEFSPVKPSICSIGVATWFGSIRLWWVCPAVSWHSHKVTNTYHITTALISIMWLDISSKCFY